LTDPDASYTFGAHRATRRSHGLDGASFFEKLEKGFEEFAG